jgi:hypothetical protein
LIHACREGPGSNNEGDVDASDGGAGHGGGGSGRAEPANPRQSLSRVLEELGVTFAYVSDFLRKVPEETRMACIMHARMENYKKDQVGCQSTA